MRIGTKMFVGYILLIIVPFICFAYFVYSQLNAKLTTQYHLANQQNIEQLSANLDASLLKIESLYSIYQNNSALIDYLRGDAMNDRDLIYAYLKEISPAFSFGSLAEPQIDGLFVYPKYQRKLLTVSGIRPYEELQGELTNGELRTLSPKQGLWKKVKDADALSLVYYHQIYNDLYTNELGILAITVRSSIIDDFVQSIRHMHPGNAIVIIDNEGRVVFRNSDATTFGQLNEAALQEFTAVGDSSTSPFIVNSAPVKRLGWTVIELNPRESLFHLFRVKQWWLVAAVGLLILLSFLYYAIVSSLTKRVILLSRHMRKVGPESLGRSYAGPAGKDELGYLISNYNAMIARMDELVNRVQKVELLKKDAEFRMLQAQIQPHFLYNTLETMRMLARSHGDSIVSEMAYSLGNLMRYSLSKKDDASLGEEWEYLRQYLDIHQIRMPELHMEWMKDEAAAALSCPRYILQPLVENSILHGLSKRRGQKTIAVRMTLDGEFVTIVVADNGVGIPEERLAQLHQMLRGTHIAEESMHSDTGGIGLGNVIQRVKAYFGPQSSLTLESKLGVGTTCTLRLYREDREHAESVDR
ncbi:sensor histidine kinase [Paenibacillus sp. PR3]|uniref:histidine kinase n=1 Tax=Paenibacillus terricola TaxID=2763503 RepID=A0ABR8MMG7_9BACL|nr:sensor histidine kinase [Paenibacillus terricola]MBD3917201.1 sensor histidine kinase [Paenibacillus terricola]